MEPHLRKAHFTQTLKIGLFIVEAHPGFWGAGRVPDVGPGYSLLRQAAQMSTPETGQITREGHQNENTCRERPPPWPENTFFRAQRAHNCGPPQPVFDRSSTRFRPVFGFELSMKIATSLLRSSESPEGNSRSYAFQWSIFQELGASPYQHGGSQPHG